MRAMHINDATHSLALPSFSPLAGGRSPDMSPSSNLVSAKDGERMMEQVAYRFYPGF